MLTLINAPKLTSLPNLPNLTGLEIFDCVLITSFPIYPKIKSLYISNISLTTLPTSDTLNVLECELMSQLVSLPLYPNIGYKVWKMLQINWFSRLYWSQEYLSYIYTLVSLGW